MNTKIHSLKKENRNYFKYIPIVAFLTFLTFYMLLKDISLTELVSIFRSLDLFMCSLALIFAIVFICCEALVFKLLLSSLGSSKSFFTTFKYSLIGFYFSSITPSASGGQPMQLYYMNKDEIEIADSSLTILITLFIYQVVMIFYAIISLIMNMVFIVEEVPSIYPLLIFGFLTNLLVMAFILMSIYSSKLIFVFLERIIKLLFKLKIIKDIDKARDYAHVQIQQFKNSASVIRSNPRVIFFVFIVTFIQLTSMYGVSYFVYRALGLKAASFWTIVGLQSISHISSSSIPLPGSIGVSEGASIIIFKNLFPLALLSSAILVIRIINYYILIVITGIFTFYIQLLYGRKRYSN